MDTFEIKTVIKFGSQSLDYLKEFEGQKIFIVTDPFMVKSGMIKNITKHINNDNCKIFSDIVPDPPIELITKGIEIVIEYKPDVVIALGGGSAIDAAKAIMHFSKVIGNMEDVKFIAVPTTSGTGSEVTSFAVITNNQKGIKYPLVSEDLLPDIAVLDCELVKSLPANVIADTGIDVLTHAIEAYVSTSATDFTDALAEKAVQLVFSYLKRSYNSSEDKEAKEKMHNASCIAGIAFNQASLGLNHAIAHNIGGKLHIPHGRVNAILLPYVIDFNAGIDGYNQKEYSIAAEKYARLAALAGFKGSNIRMSVKNFIHEIVKLEKDLNIPLTWSECNITVNQLNEVKEDIVQGALKDICIQTNPRTAVRSDILEIIQKAM